MLFHVFLFFFSSHSIHSLTPPSLPPSPSFPLHFSSLFFFFIFQSLPSSSPPPPPAYLLMSPLHFIQLFPFFPNQPLFLINPLGTKSKVWNSNWSNRGEKPEKIGNIGDGDGDGAWRWRMAMTEREKKSKINSREDIIALIKADYFISCHHALKKLLNKINNPPFHPSISPSPSPFFIFFHFILFFGSFLCIFSFFFFLFFPGAWGMTIRILGLGLRIRTNERTNKQTNKRIGC